MTATYTARKQLVGRLNAYKRCIENIEADIEEKQTEILGFHERVDVIEKAIALFGAAWTPKKVAKKLVVKKKAAKRILKVAKKAVKRVLKVAKKVKLDGRKQLHFALAHDSHSKTPIQVLISAYEEIVQDNPHTPVTLGQLVMAFNARQTKRVKPETVYSKLFKMRKSRHPELSSVFTVNTQIGGNSDTRHITLNPEAAAYFKKLTAKSSPARKNRLPAPPLPVQPPYYR